MGGGDRCPPIPVSLMMMLEGIVQVRLSGKQLFVSLMSPEFERWRDVVKIPVPASRSSLEEDEYPQKPKRYADWSSQKVTLTKFTWCRVACHVGQKEDGRHETNRMGVRDESEDEAVCALTKGRNDIP